MKNLLSCLAKEELGVSKKEVCCAGRTNAVSGRNGDENERSRAKGRMQVGGRKGGGQKKGEKGGERCGVGGLVAQKKGARKSFVWLITNPPPRYATPRLSFFKSRYSIYDSNPEGGKKNEQCG